MQYRTIEFSVASDTAVAAYWLAVGDVDLDLTNGSGAIDLAIGQTHLLTWWIEGESGGGISIRGTDAGQPVVTVKKSRIPPAEIQGAGFKRFTL